MAGYPSNHRLRARACKKRAGERCEMCGCPNRTIGFNKRGQLTMLYLHAAHRFHDKDNPDAEYLCLCPACHRAYDAVHREALRQLDRKLRTEITGPAALATIEEEQVLLKRHACLLAQEEADFQAAKTNSADQVLQARARWSRCKRLSLELQIARQIVSRLRTGNWRMSQGYREVLVFYRGKRDAYQLALEAYQRTVAPKQTSSLSLRQNRRDREALSTRS